MVHSVELVFDADTEAQLRRIWDDLRDAGIPSQAPAARPHATLTVAERIDPAVETSLAPLAARFPFPCRIGAPLLFGRADVLLARLVVPTIELLELHADVHRLCLPFLVPGPDGAHPARRSGPHTSPWLVTSAAFNSDGHCASRAVRPKSPGTWPGCAAGTVAPSASTRSTDIRTSKVKFP